MAYFEIKGVMPPMFTPFDQDSNVDYKKFTANIEKWNQTALCGYLVLGSNGETPYIDEADKVKLVEQTVKHAGKGKIVMAGTGLESTKATIELTNKAADKGAQCALILTPNYYNSQMGDDAQIAFFTDVADNSDIPILIYNVTKFTNINISAKAVKMLSEHPNIIGMKDSAGDVGQLMKFITTGFSPEFNLMVGTASAWYPSLCIGVKAAIQAAANCCPNECAEVQTLYEQGKHQEAFELYKRVYLLNACVTGPLGVPALKYAADLLGYEGGEPCKPLLPLDAAKKKQVEQILRDAQFIS